MRGCGEIENLGCSQPRIVFGKRRNPHDLTVHVKIFGKPVTSGLNEFDGSNGNLPLEQPAGHDSGRDCFANTGVDAGDEVDEMCHIGPHGMRIKN